MTPENPFQNLETTAVDAEVVQDNSAIQQPPIQQNNAAPENVQQPAQQNVQQPAQQNVQQPAQQNVQQPAQQNVQQPAQQNVQQPAQGQVQQLQTQTAQQPVQQMQQQPAPVAGGIQEVTLDSDIKTNQLEKVGKLTKGQIMKLSFVLFDGNGGPKLKMAQFFYDDVAKKSWLVPTHNPALMKACVAKYGEPKLRFVTVAAVVPTDQFGNPIQQQPGIPALIPELKAYVFSTDKLAPIKSVHREWSLAKHDLQITCEAEDFQKCSFVPAQAHTVFALGDMDRMNLVEKAESLFTSSANRFLAKEVPDAQITQYLSGVAPQNAVPGQAQPGQFQVGQQQPGQQPMQQNQDFGHLIAQQAQGQPTQ